MSDLVLASEAGSQLEAVAEGKALVAAEVFGQGGVDALLSKIEAEVRATRRDISTVKGRQAVRSLAYKVARSKTALDDLGKSLTEGWRKATDGVNSDRRVVRDRLDALADEVRGPLERWEAKDKARVAAHEAALAEITARPREWHPGIMVSSAHVAARLVALRNPPARDWEEFEDRAAEAYASEIERMVDALESVTLHEAQQAEEAARFAARIEQERQEAEAARAERDAQIAQEAAARARQDAEAKAAAQLAEAEAVRQAEAAAAERAAEEAADREAMLAAQAERERKAAADAFDAAEQKRQREAEAAQEAIAAAEQKARDEAHQAVVAERNRADAERQRIAREAEARAKDRAHRGAINRAIAAAFEDAEFTPEQAKAITTLIASGAVPHVSVAY